MLLKNYKIGIYLLVFAFITCTPKQKKKGNLNIIDINPNIGIIKEINLSKLVDSLNIVSLETNQECIISHFSNLIYLDESNIIYKSDKTILFFDGKGKFINKIAALGNGPHEYNEILDTFIDSNNRLIYIVDYLGVKIYNFKGGFIRKINTESVSPGIFKIAKNKYIGTVNQNFKVKSRQEILYLCDSTFKKTKSFYSKNNKILNVGQHIQPINSIYRVSDKVHFRTSLLDTIYQITDSLLKPHWAFNLGKYRMSIDEELNTNEFLKVRESNEKIDLNEVYESSNYFFVTFIFNKKKHFLIYEKGIGKFIFHNVYPIGNHKDYDGEIRFGINNDLIEKAPSFWPKYVNENIMVSVVSPIYLNENQRKKLNCKIDDNPLLFITRLPKD